MRHHKKPHGFLLLGAALVMMPFGCSDPAVPTDTESEADSPGGFEPTPQVGDTCEFGEGPCCWISGRTLECSAPRPGVSGVWTNQFHPGCPCIPDPQCGPTPIPPACDRIPAE